MSAPTVVSHLRFSLSPCRNWQLGLLARLEGRGLGWMVRSTRVACKSTPLRSRTLGAIYISISGNGPLPTSEATGSARELGPPTATLTRTVWVKLGQWHGPSPGAGST